MLLDTKSALTHVELVQVQEPDMSAGSLPDIPTRYLTRVMQYIKTKYNNITQHDQDDRDYHSTQYNLFMQRLEKIL